MELIMHIVFLTDNFPPEGNAIASRVYERACYWVKWGHEVTIITSAPNFPEGKIYAGYKNKWYQVEKMSGMRVVRVKTFIAQNKGFLLRIIDFLSYIFPAFFAGIIQSRPDVIVATSPQLFVGLTAWMLAFFRRKPFVLEVADIWPASIVGVGAMKDSFAIRALERLEIFLYHRATQIVVLTPAFKNNLCTRGIDENKISIVINGVELTKFAPIARATELANSYNIPNNAFVIGYLGTHGMAHALKNVLYAAEKLKSHPHILFLFVGAGAERESLMLYAQEQALTNVMFVSAQPKESMSKWWSLCDVALIHLKNDAVFAEVIPSKIFEAMGMGLPILLAAPIGCASKIICEEKVGIWVEAENPEKLAEAILQYQDEYLRQQYAAISAKCAVKYSREKQAKAMLEVISIAKMNGQMEEVINE